MSRWDIIGVQHQASTSRGISSSYRSTFVEGWPSGRRHRTETATEVQISQGFESPTLGQMSHWGIPNSDNTRRKELPVPEGSLPSFGTCPG